MKSQPSTNITAVSPKLLSLQCIKIRSKQRKVSCLLCLFAWLVSLNPNDPFSVMLGQIFFCWTSTKQ